MRLKYSNLSIIFDRAFFNSLKQQFVSIFFIVLFTFILCWGIISFDNGEIVSPWNAIGYIFDSNGYYNDLNSGFVRTSPITSILLTLLGMVAGGGILVSILVNMINSRMESYKRGYIRYNIKNHIIILGAHDLIISIIKNHFIKNDLPIVVLTSEPIDKVRDMIYASISNKCRNKILLMYGKRDSVEELIAIKTYYASKIYIIGEKEEKERDAVNIQCLRAIGLCFNKRSVKIPYCNLFYDNESSSKILDIVNVDKWTSNIRLNVNFINIYENWAHNVLVYRKAQNIEYPPLDREPITVDSNKFIHMVIVGMTPMGRALALTAAQIAHFPNFLSKKIKTKISFIDENIHDKKDSFITEYHTLFQFSEKHYINKDSNNKIKKTSLIPERRNNFLDITWNFINLNINDELTRNLLNEFCLDSCSIVTIYLCSEISSNNISISLNLPSSVYEQNIPILSYQPNFSSIIDFASTSDRFRNIKPFGMISEGYSNIIDSRHEIAMKINYLCVYFSTYGNLPTSFPPQSQLEREYSNESTRIKQSNIQIANSIEIKFRSLGIDLNQDFPQVLTDEESHLLAFIEHNRWNISMLIRGFRPTTLLEDAIIKDNPKSKIEFRNKSYALHDIRPFETMNNYSQNYDLMLVKGLLHLIKNVHP